MIMLWAKDAAAGVGLVVFMAAAFAAAKAFSSSRWQVAFAASSVA